jgi:hypothetical protein
MSLLLFALVLAHFTLLTFDTIQKDRCGQQIGASTGRNTFCKERAVESLQLLSPLRRTASTRHKNGSRTRLHYTQGLSTASIKNARVVKLGHNTEQRVQTADLLWMSCSSLLAQCGKRESRNVRKIVAGFFSCAERSVAASCNVPVRDELRLRSIREPRNGARHSCDLSCILTHLASSCSD